MMFVSHDKNNMINVISNKPIQVLDQPTKEINCTEENICSVICTELQHTKKPLNELRIAFVCNWNDACGISTYSRYIVEAILPKIKEIKIFSDCATKTIAEDEPYVERCWKRGESMRNAVAKIKEWNPDLTIIQHEFGLFPKATYFLEMVSLLKKTKYLVTLHSTYENHYDKTICTSAIENIVVHTEEARKVLLKLGHTSNIFVVPHGCITFKPEERQELWNLLQTDYAILQFGFGFGYKNVIGAIEAVHHLKTTDPKFKNIFYVYLCSTSQYSGAIHNAYCDLLNKKIEDLGLQDNCVIIAKFQDEKIINNYIRTFKMCIFPYAPDPNSNVYGASGAIKICMANGRPCIASKCHLFDDIEGIVPRIGSNLELAHEIDKIFSDGNYREDIVRKSLQYCEDNSWNAVADKYLDLYYKV